MIAITKVTEDYPPDSDFIRNLVHVFCEARKKHLAFLMDIHDTEEDKRHLSGPLLRENQVWVAAVNGNLAGFIAFANGWVNHLYIAPEFQRRGIGTRLLEIAKAATAGVQLWVFEVNAPAIQFYLRQGFRIVERTDGMANEAKMPDVRMEWNGAKIELA